MRLQLSDGASCQKTLAPSLAELARLMHDVTGWPLAAGNQVEPLVDGDAAYPAMLQAIDEARVSIGLCSYIFDNDRVGHTFIEALRRAQQRGVKVRVLVDDIGANYTWPTAVRRLRRLGVPTARFLRTFVPGWFPYANLRNHRKILVADGKLGFTGGMNIREGHQLSLAPAHPVRDVHFRVRGPVVAHLAAVFADDWAFSTDEALDGDDWFPPLHPCGNALARGIPVGPDEHFEKLRMAFLGGLACARESVRISTPYFLPDAALITSLNVAAMRGVQVDIVLPEKCNLRLVGWASRALLWQVLERGCRVWLMPPPFDHTKLMVVDRAWTLLGSGNWDPRSLRLNFEFNLECYDERLAATLDELIAGKIAQSRRVTLEEVDSRRLPVRLRDGLARLMSPYL
jgi:cardiolipin synthase